MPLYEYQHPKTKKKISVIQSMSEPHQYIDELGVKWDRVFSIPNASIDSQIDPFSEQAFKEKTKNFKGTIGDLYDMSKELSEKRAAKRGGTDPIKDKSVKEYEKKTKKKHPTAYKKKDKIII